MNLTGSKRLFSSIREAERGVALITTLLLTLLMTALTMAMVFSVRSDMLINRYYRNYRGSFYAADSALNIGRQALENSLEAQIPANFPIGNAPLPAGVDGIVTADVQAKYVNKAFSPINGSGSYPENFTLTQASLTSAGCTTDVAQDCVTGLLKAKLFTYKFQYRVAATGQSSSFGNEKATLADEGVVTLTATVTPATANQNFAGWGMFIDQSPICNGSTLVPGVISGPVFTNGAWNFGASGAYTFTDTVGSASAKAGYQFSGSCDQVAGPADKTIAPKFEAGLTLNAPKVGLPTNDFNQLRAVLDGKGGGGTVSTSDLQNALRDVKGNQYNGGSSGVFLPYTQQNGKNIFKGGGIYVESGKSTTTNVTMTAGTGTTQIYTIQQGGKTTTITVNPDANNGLNDPTIPGTTVISDGANTTTVLGVPQMYDQASGVPIGPATSLYVDGAINSLSGPASGAAIADKSQITVTGNGNVTITGDIKYRNPPVQLATDPVTGLVSDNLIPANDTRQALGIFTANGDIQLAVPKSGNNLEIDASVATLCDPSAGQCTGGNGGLVNNGNSINTLTIIGSRIQNQIKNIGATTRNVVFDKRFAQPNFSPPWFPSTTLAIAGKNQTSVNKPTWKRTLWKNTSNF